MNSEKRKRDLENEFWWVGWLFAVVFMVLCIAMVYWQLADLPAEKPQQSVTITEEYDVGSNHTD